MNNLIFLSPFVFVSIFWLEGAFPYFKQRPARFSHAVNNIAIAVIDGSINLGFLLTAVPFVVRFARMNSFGLGNSLAGTRFAVFLAVFALFDFWMYLWHRANHRAALLWRLHRAHHNDIMMDSTTALRFHPFEIIISAILNLGIVALLGMDLTQIIVYNAFLQAVILFHHSNIALPEKFDRILRAVIVTPNMHRVHHSVEYKETNSNYSSVFSFWDRIFATFRKRQDTHSIIYGLRILRDRKWQGARGFLAIPFYSRY